MKLIKYAKNMDKILIVFKDRLDRGKRLNNPSLKQFLNIKTSSDFLQTKMIFSE